MRNGILRAFLILAATGSMLSAANFTFSGTFVSDSAIQLFTFQTSGGTRIRTLSYGGGSNVNSSLVLSGGFDPLLNIFLSNGDQVGSFDDSAGGTPCIAGSGISAGSNGCLDSYFSGSLAAGTYTLALTQFDNLLNGSTLGDGFLSQHLCSSNFCDGFDNVTARTGRWEVDIIAATSASVIIAGVPEPGTVALAFGGVCLVAFSRRAGTFQTR